MKHQPPTAILRDDRALILVPEALRVSTKQDYGDQTAEVELHLSREDYEALSRQMPGKVHDLLVWLVSLDDPDPESQGFQDRRTVTMTGIIQRARAALGKTEREVQGDT